MIRWEVRGPAGWVTFDRPEAHNAMTFEMYEELFACCTRADDDDAVRVLVLRGAGGRAFVAGTDIRQFLEFSSGEDGLEYERTIDRVVGRLERVRVPTIALVDGFAMGSGLAWPPPATCGSARRTRCSGCRSRARWATACRWRTTRGWRRCSARRA